jgi:hypothetical protein
MSANVFAGGASITGNADGTLTLASNGIKTISGVVPPALGSIGSIYTFTYGNIQASGSAINVLPDQIEADGSLDISISPGTYVFNSQLVMTSITNGIVYYAGTSFSDPSEAVMIGGQSNSTLPVIDVFTASSSGIVTVLKSVVTVNFSILYNSSNGSSASYQPTSSFSLIKIA